MEIIIVLLFNFMKIINFNKNPLIRTPDHTGVHSREVTGKGIGCIHCDVKVGYYQPGGESIVHSHPKSEHVFYMISGELTFIDDSGEEMTIYPEQALYISASEVHKAVNKGDSIASYLAITAPPT